MVLESVRTNISGIQIIQQLHNTDNRVQTNLERIASGLRINRASDDPGGFVFSNKLYTQFRGLSQASDNTQEAISLTNTADSAVSSIIDLLTDIRTAAVAASGGSATQQSVIQEKLDELNHIANTTKFGGKYLLNGSMTTTAGFKEGTRDFGASLSFGPDATTLFSGRSYLNIAVTDAGSTQIKNGGDATFNTGIANLTDIAVTTAQFNNGGAAPGTGTNLAGLTANRVSIENSDFINFSGMLADGATFFSGSYSISSSSTVGNLVSAIQNAIDAAEQSIGIDGTGVLETTAGIDSNGRLQFTSGTAQDISQFDFDITLKNNASQTKTAFSISHDANIYNQEYGGTATGANIGNSVTSVTGSTFDSGTFTITVSNIISAQQRQVTTQDQFDQDNFGTAVIDTTNLNGSILNGVTLSTGDTFQINGTNPDGTTFTSTYTIGADTGVGDGIIETYQTLVDELNNRNQTLTGRGFNGAVATLTGNGEIQLIDDVAATSSTDLQIFVSAGNQTINSQINQAGSEEKATISIDSGSAQEVNAGQVVTLTGTNLSGGPVPEMTFRVGSGFSAGDDELDTTAKTYVGSLNGGDQVTFQNGDQQVTFTSGEFSIYPIKKYQQVTLDFDAIVDVTTLNTYGGETFTLSTTSNTANFQIGGDAGDIKQYLFADLRSQNLGTDATNNLDSIDVTTASGATAAISIIDDALDQVNGFAGRLGAFSSRLDDTITTLDNGATNIETAYTQIVSADIAQEATDLTTNSLLMQAQSAVLAQANSLPLAVLNILLDLK